MLYSSMKVKQSVPKLGHIKFRCRGITQKKEYNMFFIVCYYCSWVLKRKLNVN
jgi:hypothetical protein